MSNTQTILVGSEWITCPFCLIDYRASRDRQPHHPACLVERLPGMFCVFCGARKGREGHNLGCPSVTGLYPIWHPDAFTCNVCSAAFRHGDCYVYTDRGRVCLGCAWAP